jgi:hypothetical protein
MAIRRAAAGVEAEEIRSRVSLSGPLRLLCVGRHPEMLAQVASSRAVGTSCLLADDVTTALIVLDAVPVDAVVCALDGHDSSRLFKRMRTRHGRVLRILVTSRHGLAYGCADAAAVASAVVTHEGAANIPWLVGSTLDISPAAR